MPELKKLVSQSVAARLDKGHFVPGHFGATKPRYPRTRGARKLFDLFEGEQRLDFQVIGLSQLMGLQDAIGQFAVIGEKHQAA